MAKAQAKLTEGALRALEALRGQGGYVTLAELNAGLEQPVGSAHLGALKARGLVETEQVEREQFRPTKVNAYVAIEKDVDAEDKLTAGMVSAYDVLKGIDGPATLAEMNVGLETPIAIAHLTGLVRKGYASAEQVEREQVRVVKVNSYILTEDGLNYSQA
jgi:DNA-binding transcriptional ArsR family regulator